MRTVMWLLFLASPAFAGDEEYKLGPDSLRWLWRAAEPKADAK